MELNRFEALMPSIDQNVVKWNSRYNWPKAGDEWSRAWGCAEMQWNWTVLPRIRFFLPAATVVEIAPGFGRWTRFLLPSADRFVGIDISENCIAECKVRFSNEGKALFVVNDGLSLPCVDDGTADFVFSMDSLVHAESDVIESYVAELARTLSPDGVAFIHHSNLGEYPLQTAFSGMPYLRVLLRAARICEPSLHWRATSMTAGRMLEFARRHGLQCVTQELVNWGTRRTLIDCLSVLARPGSRWAHESKQLRNFRFMEEASMIKHLSELYSGSRSVP